MPWGVRFLPPLLLQLSWSFGLTSVALMSFRTFVKRATSSGCACAMSLCSPGSCITSNSIDLPAGAGGDGVGGAGPGETVPADTHPAPM